MAIQEFEHLTLYMQVLGFMTKVAPSYSRFVHVFNFCQLDIMAIQLLLLPECNSSGLIVIFGTSRSRTIADMSTGICVFLWWAVIVLGVWAKQSIFVPPFLYEPLRPGRTFSREIHKIMRAFGP